MFSCFCFYLLLALSACLTFLSTWSNTRITAFNMLVSGVVFSMPLSPLSVIPRDVVELPRLVGWLSAEIIHGLNNPSPRPATLMAQLVLCSCIAECSARAFIEHYPLVGSGPKNGHVYLQVAVLYGLINMSIHPPEVSRLELE